MRKFRSSIFSFDTLALGDRFTRAGSATLVGACAVLLALEIVARLAFAPVGIYWEFWDRESAEKFAWYREEAIQHRPAEILIVGDSTAARDFVPQTISEYCPGNRAINLGWPANFPLAFRDITIPLLAEPYHPPKLVVMSLSPKSFVDSPVTRRFEAPIRGCAFARRNRGEIVLADDIWMARFASCKPFSSNWFGRDHASLPPPDFGAMLLEGQEPENSVRPNRDEHHGLLSTERLNVLLELVRVAKQRQFHLVVIVPPRNFDDRIDLETDYLKFVRSVEQDRHVTVLDYRDLSELTDQHFFDPGHLNRAGAIVFSEKIGSRLHDAIREMRLDR